MAITWQSFSNQIFLCFCTLFSYSVLFVSRKNNDHVLITGKNSTSKNGRTTENGIGTKTKTRKKLKRCEFSDYSEFTCTFDSHAVCQTSVVNDECVVRF